MSSEEKTEKGKDADEAPGKEVKVAEQNEVKSPTSSSKENDAPKTPDSKSEAIEENAEGDKIPTLRDQFKAFSKFGDTKSDGKTLTLSQSDKWMKQAKVIDGKTVTTTDTAIHFKKFKTMKMTFPDFEKYLAELTKAKQLEVGDMKKKLRSCGTPGLTGATTVVKSNAVDRLTDTKKYTGSHKLRFDSAGKGKGTAGRKDAPNTSGYVSGYKNKDAYDKSH